MPGMPAGSNFYTGLAGESARRRESLPARRSEGSVAPVSEGGRGSRGVPPMDLGFGGDDRGGRRTGRLEPDQGRDPRVRQACGVSKHQANWPKSRP